MMARDGPLYNSPPEVLSLHLLLKVTSGNVLRVAQDGEPVLIAGFK